MLWRKIKQVGGREFWRSVGCCFYRVVRKVLLKGGGHLTNDLKEGKEGREHSSKDPRCECLVC